MIVPSPSPEQSPSKRGRAARGNTAGGVVSEPPPPSPRHVFHRRYVYDTDQDKEEDMMRNKKSRRISTNKRQSGVFYRQCEHVTYHIPFREVTLLRAVVLAAVENLIRLERQDDHAASDRNDKDHSPCC